MYQSKIEDFGPYQRYTLYNTAKGHAMAIVPAYGANLLSTHLHGYSLLDGYTTPEELTANSWSKNVVLFPFPNRLKDGRYQFNGQEYHFPINNASTANAIHGFGRTLPMEVDTIATGEKEAAISCSYRDKGERANYPFAHTFRIVFRLSDAEGLRVTMSFENNGTVDLPVGLGWHPYFKFDRPVEELTLQLPPCRMVEIDDRMIPTGERSTYDAFASPRKIEEVNLDNCFALEAAEGSVAEAIVSLPEGRLRYWQEAGPGRFDYLQVFTPPARHAIALEPMTCNVDAFNNSEGLYTLAPGERLSGDFGFNFQPANP
ncbi:MAG: hypothetical protein AAGG75_19215 [Bacteroidota bacterium]